MIDWIKIEERQPSVIGKFSRNMRIKEDEPIYISEIVIILGKWYNHENGKWLPYINCARLYRDFDFSKSQYFWIDSEGNDFNFDWQTVITHWAVLPEIPSEILTEESFNTIEGMNILNKSKYYDEMSKKYEEYIREKNV